MLLDRSKVTKLVSCLAGNSVEYHVQSKRDKYAQVMSITMSKRCVEQIIVGIYYTWYGCLI